jgi:hypothetical protein
MNPLEVLWWLLSGFVVMAWSAHPLLVLVLVLFVAACLWEPARRVVELVWIVRAIFEDWRDDRRYAPDWAFPPSPFRRRRQRQLSATEADPATCPPDRVVPIQARGVRLGRAAVHGPTETGGATPFQTSRPSRAQRLTLHRGEKDAS